ncbi:MAG: hypothetical protein ACW98F_05655 [Candidatus Hodarchaeales archaeon]|jgi:hypothetical protein
MSEKDLITDIVMVEETPSSGQPREKSILQRIRGYFRSQKLKEPSNTLQGKALQVYWFLLTHPHGIAGIREIQKELRFTSSGTAAYQINKLIADGVVSKNEQTDKYFVTEEVKSGILGFYIRLGYRMIPRLMIYLTVFILGLFIYLWLAVTKGDEFITDPTNWLFLFFLIFGCIAFVIESYKIWLLKPD